MPWNEVETGGVWKPKEIGERFEGVLKSRVVKDGKNNQKYTDFTFEKDGEEFHISGAVLESKLAQVEDGARVLLMYKGKPKGTYLDFTVQVWTDQPEI